jgi:hypothetical protein
MPFPLPPHDPRERELVACAGAWQVMQFGVADARLAYFTPRGFLHLQLWHPTAKVSVLTPSRLTAGTFEVWFAGGERFRARDWRELAAALGRYNVSAPSEIEVRALERWLVARNETPTLRLLRTWWRAPRANARGVRS